MRFLGNKTRLLHFIEDIINKYNIQGEIFADIFAGTGSVGDHFKGNYKIISNDYMGFSYIINCAKLLNSNTPLFVKFTKKYKTDPFTYLNTKKYYPNEHYFIFNNYSEQGKRKYFTEENALKIDGMRLDIEDFYKENIISFPEYSFLLASLLESTMKVSNTTGTYQAFLKYWENRAKKIIIIEPLQIEKHEINENNKIYCEDANTLARHIEGDIVYIDPPYTTTQYTNSYHLLETIMRYDYPEIFGKTGRRKNRNLSNYSVRQKAIYEFEDLFRQLQFKHILVSYSNQSMIDLSDLIQLAKKFAKENKVYVEKFDYREYSTNNSSYKGKGQPLKEVLIYFEKDLKINKSPLNYSGSKDNLILQISRLLPKHISTFVDAMGGAFNIGANVFATDKVIYNEYNKKIFEIIKMLLENDPQSTIDNIEKIIRKYSLTKKNKTAYLKLRSDYNKQNDPLLLFVLQIYSFQNMIRFNSSQQMNTPVGNNEFGEGIKERLKNFKTKTQNYQLQCKRYQTIEPNSFDSDTIFYFDPPYFITNAEYNDGKRGLDGWDSNSETELLNFLLMIHNMGYKFMLSNVLQHNGKKHNLLIDWISEHNFYITVIGKTGKKYPREEVVITNYLWNKS